MKNEVGEVKRVNVNIDASLHRAFKVAVAAQGKEMTDVLLEFIKRYVADHGLMPKKRGR